MDPCERVDPGDIHVLTCLPADASAAHTELAASLVELGQAHLFESWPPAGEQDEEKRQMLAQLAKLEANYPGGLAAYIQSARNLLGQSVRGDNPLQGWSPSVPDDGFDLTPGSDEFARHEERGLAEAAHMAFAVPAGGLGERLGFSGVKFALPSEVSTGSCVLRVYASYILALQRHVERAGGGPCRLPLAVMVSDDTVAGIQRLLDENGYFGLEPSQVWWVVRGCRRARGCGSNGFVGGSGDAAQAGEGRRAGRQRGAARAQGRVRGRHQAARPRRHPLPPPLHRHGAALGGGGADVLDA